MEKIENIKSPFMCYCAKVIPLAFDESMSYYECLCNFYNYLKNEVMEVINNNADATKELQDLFIELKYYVEHYFDNLDLQEEIDNKLDDMLESGQLVTVISEFLSLTVIYEYNTVSDMKLAQNLANGITVKTFGYHEYNDGGSSYYLIRTKTNEDITDEKKLIALSNNTLVAELIIKNHKLNVKQIGAYGDGETDDTNIINYALSLNEVNEVYLPSGNYYISNQLLFTHDNSKLYGDLNSTKLIYEDNLEGVFTSFIASNGLYNIEVRKLIIDGGTQTTSRYFMSLINGGNIYISDIEAYHGQGYVTRLNSDVNVFVKDMYIHDIRNENVVTGGVYGQETSNFNIENIKGYNLGDHLVYISGDDVICKNVNIRNIHGTNIGMDELTNGATITIYGYTQDVIIDNCYIDNSLMGINVSSHNDTVETPKNVTISNCIIKNSRGSGILTTGTDDNKIKNFIVKGNIIDTAVDDGVSIRYVDNYIIENNIIEECGRFGIQNRTNSSNGTIVGNSLHNIAQVIHVIYLNKGLISNNYYNADDDYIASTNGITVQSSSSNVVLSNNYITNCNNYNIRVRGSNNKLICQPSNDMNMTNGTPSLMFGVTPASLTTGDYAVGDIILNTNASAGQPFGWVCVSAGTPGTWKVISTIQS